MKRLFLFCIVLLMGLCLLGGCAWRPAAEPDVPPAETEVVTQAPDTTLPKLTLDQLTFASYEEVYQALYGSDRADQPELLSGEGMVAEEAAVDDMDMAAEPAAGMTSADTGGLSGETGVSGTNVQVQGVDEGDIVKNDADFIYILRDNKLLIVSAAGEGSKELSATVLFTQDQEQPWKEQEDGSYRYEYGWVNANELYLWGQTAAVVLTSSHSVDSYDAVQDVYAYESSQTTEVQLWDVSDPAQPRLTATLGQDGSYTNSRLVDGVLYLVSGYSVWDAEEDDPDTYIPRLYRNGAAELTGAGKIGLLPGGGDGYLVISAIDLAKAEIRSTLSVAGGNYGTMYMSLENLYLAVSTWETVDGPARTESVYQVVEHTERNLTRLLRVSLTDGEIALAATGIAPGYVIGQFALDEYEGYLRLVTTDSSYTYTTYTDSQFDFTNYQYPEEQEPQTNGLYTLDETLAIVGQVDGLAPGEQVYSVRFDGEVAYFVTYEQVDPLFAVDLSQPEQPTVMSALKIPGFSQYLHIWQEDSLLLGLGYSTNQRSQTENLKLSMFDISDPFDVTEATTQELEAGYSVALYNHHAALIDPDRNLICFPADGQYLIYSYDPAQGFTQTAAIPIDDFGHLTRGLYSGQWFYIVGSGQVYVLRSSDWQLLTIVPLSAGGETGEVIIYDQQPTLEPQPVEEAPADELTDK